MNMFSIVSSACVVGAAAGFGAAWLFRYFERRRLVPASYQTSFLYSGNLKQTSAVDAIQFLELQKREGILHIYCGRRKGYITFLAGRIIDAFYRNLTGREAMFAMLDLTEGDFYFEPKAINQPQLISDSIMDLVMTWDERKRAGIKTKVD
jgi:hypothetical protein